MSSRNYILFIDESGKSKLSDDDKDSFLLSGLIIDKDLHEALSSYMVSLKQKSDIPVDENIHAFDLFEGERRRLRDASGKILKDREGNTRHARIPFSRIDTFFRRLSSLIEGADMYCYIFRINKATYQERIRRTATRKRTTTRSAMNQIKRHGLNDFLYEALARRLVLEFGHFLEQEDAYGEIVAESRRQEDQAVLSAFVAASHEDNFLSPRFRAWSKASRKRIHSLTFQNKKGLSFGLEVADLFGWTHFNRHYGREFPIASAAKIRRVEGRIEKVNELMNVLYRKGRPEEASLNMVQTVALDRVSEFTKALKAVHRP